MRLSFMIASRASRVAPPMELKKSAKPSSCSPPVIRMPAATVRSAGSMPCQSMRGAEQDARASHADDRAGQREISDPALHPSLGKALHARHRQARQDLHRDEEIDELSAHAPYQFGCSPGKSAIAVSISCAMRTSGMASAAPVPSPSRSPRSSSGLAPKPFEQDGVAGLGRTVGEQQVIAKAGSHRDGGAGGGGGDEAVHQNHLAEPRGPVHRARHHGHLVAAEFDERLRGRPARARGHRRGPARRACAQGLPEARRRRCPRAFSSGRAVTACATRAAALVLPMPISPSARMP